MTARELGSCEKNSTCGKRMWERVLWQVVQHYGIRTQPMRGEPMQRFKYYYSHRSKTSNTVPSIHDFQDYSHYSHHFVLSDFNQEKGRKERKWEGNKAWPKILVSPSLHLLLFFATPKLKFLTFLQDFHTPKVYLQP